MTRAWGLLCVLATAWACSGETSSDGSSSSGGTSSGGTSTGGTSSGGTSAGGNPSGGSSAGGTSSGGTSTGGASGAGGSSAGGGTSGSGGATDAGVTCQEGGTVDAAAEAVIAESCVVAVVKVARIDEECSGAGGAHVTFDVVAIGKGGGVTKVQHGGHAYYAPASGPDKVGEYFVAGIDPYGKLVPQPDNPGWCIVGLPPVDGYAHTFIEATSEADAKAKMQALLAS